MPRITVAVLLIILALVAGCRDRSPARRASAGPPRVAALSELTEAEKQYGHSAAPDPAVTYQPDVVLMPDGAAAIRALSADGLVWTIDPDAEDANDIRVGKVLLLTSRAVGRVLSVENASDGLRVILGPVEITEVIRDGEFNFNQPIDLTHGLSFARPELFDPPRPIEPLVHRLERPDRFGMVVRPVALMQGNKVTQHTFTATPLLDSRGIGVRIASTGDGVRFLGEAVLYVKTPELHFVLEIKGGKVIAAEVELSGVAGLLLSFEAGMPRPTDANLNAVRPADNDWAIPLLGLKGVPFAISVRQLFSLQTAFTSTGALKARGYYVLKGGIKAGYRDGRFGVGGPTGFADRETLLPSLDGVALGPVGMVMTHQVNVMVGLGAAGFVTGPYALLNSSVTATHGSSIGAVLCRQEGVSMGVGAGVGYRMPDQVASAINSVLSLIGVSERIKSSAGLETKTVVIVQKGWYHPAVAVCGKK